ncbi:MAG: VWA domain-containing protein [Muribaculaceae bacterium]|nr:VWA domain-containing protein [Muribaculaceae bacterium]
MNRKTILYCFFALLMLFPGSFNLSAQREKNNIYLFDCTGSMIQNRLWEPAKKSLDETVKLDASIPGSHVVIIPFGDNPYEIFSFDAKDYPNKEKAIFNSFDKYIKEAKYTHITPTMTEGLKYIDNNKDNRIYLLTDGQPNHDDSPEKVAEAISKWCSGHKNSRFFYVALTKGALHDLVRKALEECPDAYIVEIEGNVIPQFADLSSDVYTNLEELSSPSPIEFNLPGEYEVTPVSDDPYFDVKIENNKAKDGKILLSLIPKTDIGELHQILRNEDYDFKVKIVSPDKRYYIVNPEVNVHVSDQIPTKLYLGDGNPEIAADGARWHDSFLWSKAAPDQKITWDLNPIFENKLPESGMQLKFSVPDGSETDFKAWYNDQPLSNGEQIKIEPDQPAILSIQFDHKAKTGKRYFELTPVKYSGLDLINNTPAEEYKGTTLRTAYFEEWNPLGQVFFWVAMGLIALIILWFLFIQRWMYPRIKMSKMEVTGPDSFYTSKKIKGARKVVLTSKKKKQNIFSRLFTGEVKYVKADHFDPELEIVPSGSKKKVKINHAEKGKTNWEISPSSIYRQDEKGSIKHKETSDESHIFFS